MAVSALQDCAAHESGAICDRHFGDQFRLRGNIKGAASVYWNKLGNVVALVEPLVLITGAPSSRVLQQGFHGNGANNGVSGVSGDVT